MKNNKLLTSLFVLGMGLSLVACGSSDGGTTTKTDGTKTVEKKEEQKFADRKEYETEGLACNFKLPNLDSFYLVKGLEKPVYNTELSLGNTKYEVYDDYLPVLLVYVGDDAFAEWSDGYTIEELATKDLNGEAEYTETKVGGYRALVADLSDEDNLKNNTILNIQIFQMESFVLKSVNMMIMIFPMNLQKQSLKSSKLLNF